jgi:hypothetical protein
MSSLLELVRPHPHRGDVIAAGAVPLALAAIVIELRMTQWSLGSRFLVVAGISILLMPMAWLAPLEYDTPRAYHSVLLVAGLLPLIFSLQLLGEVLGAHRPPGAGANAWAFGAEAGIAATAARRANSAVCTLIAALAGALAVEAFFTWVFQPSGPGLFRALLLVLTLGFAAGAIALRDIGRRHAVQLVNAAGLVTIVLALTFLVQSAITSAVSNGFGVAGLLSSTSGGAFGWKLYVLAIGFGLVAYAGVDREPGPGYIGTVLLLMFALLVGPPFGPGGGSLLGWPLFLLAVGIAGLAIGLRPRQPLPPPPGPVTVAPTVPIRGEQSDG